MMTFENNFNIHCTKIRPNTPKANNLWKKLYLAKQMWVPYEHFVWICFCLFFFFFEKGLGVVRGGDVCLLMLLFCSGSSISSSSSSRISSSCCYCCCCCFCFCCCCCCCCLIKTTKLTHFDAFDDYFRIQWNKTV